MQIVEPAAAAPVPVGCCAPAQPFPDCMKKPLCITVICSAPPLFIETTAANFRSVVQGLTGRPRRAAPDQSSSASNNKETDASPELATDSTAATDLLEWPTPSLDVETVVRDNERSLGLPPSGCVMTAEDYTSAVVVQLDNPYTANSSVSTSHPTAMAATPDLFHLDISNLPALIDGLDEEQLPEPIELPWDTSSWEGDFPPDFEECWLESP